MRLRLAAYSAYAVGSTVFLFVAVRRGSELLVVGSVLFLLGTLLLLVPTARSAKVGRSR